MEPILRRYKACEPQSRTNQADVVHSFGLGPLPQLTIWANLGHVWCTNWTHVRVPRFTSPLPTPFGTRLISIWHILAPCYEIQRCSVLCKDIHPVTTYKMHGETLQNHVKPHFQLFSHPVLSREHVGLRVTFRPIKRFKTIFSEILCAYFQVRYSDSESPGA